MLHSIFAIELCYPIVSGSTLRDDLNRLIRDHPRVTGPREKWELYSRAGDILTRELNLARSGCWDFFDDDQKARADHDMWYGGMKTEEGARKEPSGEGGERFLTFTMSFLMVQGAASERALCRICDIPESRLWTRATFATVLKGLRALSFSSVKSDVIYLIPGEESWGLTREDLQDPKFHYLRPIT